MLNSPGCGYFDRQPRGGEDSDSMRSRARASKSSNPENLHQQLGLPDAERERNEHTVGHWSKNSLELQFRNLPDQQREMVLQGAQRRDMQQTLRGFCGRRYKGRYRMRQEDSGYGGIQSVGRLDEEMQEQAVAEYWKLQTTKTMVGNIIGIGAIKFLRR